MSKRIKIAYVRWRDAFATETDDGEPHLVQHSAGILLAANRKCVKLAQIWDPEDSRDVLTIPRAYVEEFRVLETLPLSTAKAGKKAAKKKQENNSDGEGSGIQESSGQSGEGS